MHGCRWSRGSKGSRRIAAVKAAGARVEACMAAVAARWEKSKREYTKQICRDAADRPTRRA